MTSSDEGYGYIHIWDSETFSAVAQLDICGPVGEIIWWVLSKLIPTLWKTYGWQFEDIR